MHSLDFLYDLIGQYGLYAVFILVMLEGDITLLLAGVLAHSHFFGDRSFAWVLLWGTLGGCASDNVAYFAGRAFCQPFDSRFRNAIETEFSNGLTKGSPGEVSDVIAGPHVSFMGSGTCLTYAFSW